MSFMIGDVNIFAYNINEVEFVGEFVSGEFSEIITTLFTNIVITTEMMEKFDLFLIKNKDRVIKFRGKEFNLVSLLKRVKSLMQSPETIWKLFIRDLEFEYRISDFEFEYGTSDDICIRITIGRYDVTVSFVEDIYCKTIMFLSN